MKLSISWIFDHIDADWKKQNIDDLVAKFNKISAEIESFYKVNFDNPFELFNLKKDYLELNNKNKINDPFFINSIKFKTELILKKMAQSSFKSEDPVEKKELSADTIKSLKSLGYID